MALHQAKGLVGLDLTQMESMAPSLKLNRLYGEYLRIQVEEIGRRKRSIETCLSSLDGVDFLKNSGNHSEESQGGVTWVSLEDKKCLSCVSQASHEISFV